MRGFDMIATPKHQTSEGHISTNTSEGHIAEGLPTYERVPLDPPEAEVDQPHVPDDSTPTPSPPAPYRQSYTDVYKHTFVQNHRKLLFPGLQVSLGS